MDDWLAGKITLNFTPIVKVHLVTITCAFCSHSQQYMCHKLFPNDDDCVARQTENQSVLTSGGFTVFVFLVEIENEFIAVKASNIQVLNNELANKTDCDFFSSFVCVPEFLKICVYVIGFRVNFPLAHSLYRVLTSSLSEIKRLSIATVRGPLKGIVMF